MLICQGAVALSSTSTGGAFSLEYKLVLRVVGCVRLLGARLSSPLKKNKFLFFSLSLNVFLLFFANIKQVHTQHCDWYGILDDVLSISQLPDALG